MTKLDAFQERVNTFLFMETSWILCSRIFLKYMEEEQKAKLLVETNSELSKLDEQVLKLKKKV